MGHLTKQEEEFVAVGAAIGSNCIPCVIYHVGELKKLGISKEKIVEAFAMADKVRKVPADKVMNAARAQLAEDNQKPETPNSKPSCCG